MPTEIKIPGMIAPTMMPAFVPELRLGSPLSVGSLEEEGCRVILLTVSVVATEVVGEYFEGKGVIIESVRVELPGIDDIDEHEISFNCSNGVAWKVSELGSLQCMSVDAVEQQAHNCEVLL